jgi:beta-lactamase class A
MRLISRAGCCAAILAVALLLPCGVALGAGLKAPARPSNAEFQRHLEAIASRFGGKVTLAGVDLKTGERFGLHPNRPVATASVIKLPVMVEAFYLMQEGKLKWSQPVKETAFDRVPGSGILQFLNPQIGLTLGDAITLMIDLSDNTAANMVIHQTGIAPVNARMRKLGLKHTKLFGYVFHARRHASAEAKKFGLGMTTASDMVRLLTMIQKHEILSPAACDHMLKILGQQQDNDAFPRYTSNMPGVTWDHKTGALNAVRNDVGIAETPAGPIVLAGFAYDSPDRQWTADNAALLVLARLGRAVLDHFLPAAKATTRP